MPQLTIIDTFGYFFRCFHGMPKLENKDGFPTGMLKGFSDLLMRLYNDKSCEYLAFALEGLGKNRRKEIFEDYKANRKDAPEELKQQIPIAIQWLEKMNLKTIQVDGFEADDSIASLAIKAESMGFEVRIISQDKDLYQLINKNIFLYDPVKNKDIRENECIEKFGVTPSEFIDFQSMVGDSSDNVVGIKGIGEKTAASLIKHFGSLEKIYENLDKLDEVLKPAAINKIMQGKESAFISKQLVTLRKDLDIPFNPIDYKKPESNPLTLIIKELEQYNFSNVIKKITHTNLFDLMDTNTESSPESKKTKLESNVASINSFSYNPILLTNLESILKVLDSASKDELIAYDSETTGLDVKKDKIVGFSFCLESNPKNAYYVPIAHRALGATNIDSSEVTKALSAIFSHKIVGHNLKFDLQIIESNFGDELLKPLKEKNKIYDSMLLAWLAQSGEKIGLDFLMKKHFNHDMIEFSQIVPKNDDFSCLNTDIACSYAAEDAAATLALFKKLESNLKERNLNHLIDLASNLEYPFIFVLMEMEKNGIKLDLEHFKNLESKFNKKLSALESEIFTLTGEAFNIKSPNQLGEVLFNHLGLQTKRKIKSGFSTDEKVLNSLIDSHPVIAKILEYREYSKLLGTYVEPMLTKHIDSRIYTQFLQSGTATGRLSSRAPNLQNIPVRSDLGKEIRKGFIASEENLLISIDYSQIELRLLAHFSMDSVLVNAFNNNLDIHLQTAKALFGEENAKEKRHIAKSINFGLIYGMGARKLGETLKIPTNEAKSYIEGYFATFPSVRQFLKNKENEILDSGYAQTILGRRRYFNFNTASDFLKSDFLREGINSIFQGSAADLIKLAMLQILEELQDEPIKMLLQVHDELIFEARLDMAENLAKRIEKIMNSVYSLNVPLSCSVALGKNWSELK